MQNDIIDLYVIMASPAIFDIKILRWYILSRCMNKNMFFSLLIFAVTFCFLLAACDNDAPNDDRGPVLVCFGDSLTAGRNATSFGADDKSKSYPAFLQKKVNIPVINAGESGNTSAQALLRVNGDVLSKNPRIVIILLGANDFFQQIHLTSTQPNLQSIIDKLNNGNRQIYLAKFYNESVAMDMGAVYKMPEEAVKSLINDYDAMFNALASSDNVTLIEDIWQDVWGVHMSEDNFHPNAAGYEIMAGTIFNVLQPYLEENGLLE